VVPCPTPPATDLQYYDAQPRAGLRRQAISSANSRRRADSTVLSPGLV
jgi:hypothetical protein